MDQAVLCADVSQQRKQTYSIGRYYAYWPSLVHDFQDIHKNKALPLMTERVRALRNQVAKLDAEVREKGELFLGNCTKLGNIIERQDSQSPAGARYEFSGLESLQFLITYVMLLVIFNRLLHNLDALSGRPEEPLDHEHRALCRQLWMCIPYVRALGGMTSILFAAPLYLSYEGAVRQPEREYLLDCIIEIAEKRGRYPKDRKTVEMFVLNTARSMAGQRPFATVFTSE